MSSFGIFYAQNVLQLISHSCVVLVTPPLFNQTNFLLDFASSVLHPNDIHIGIANIDIFSDEYFVSLKLSSFGGSKKLLPESSFIVLDKKLADRTCISFTPTFQVLKGDFLNLSEINKLSLLNIVNQRCDSNYKLDGSLNNLGLHEKYILENLFSLKSEQDSVTMQQVVCDYGLNLKETFYEGVNQNECPLAATKIKSTIPLCSEIDGFISADKFRQDFLFRSKPVIFRRALFNQPWDGIMHNWTQEMFRKKYGSTAVRIMLAPIGGDYEGVESAELWQGYPTFIKEMPKKVQQSIQFKDIVVVRPAVKQMPLASFLDYVDIGNTGVSAYLEYASVRKYFQDLIKEFAELPLSEGLHLDHFNLWLSDGNTLGKLHFDQYDNFLAQIRGRKQVLLFEPHNNAELYEGHIVEAYLQYSNGSFYRNDLQRSTARTMSPVDITTPDFSKYPAFSKARPYNCTIGEGDILYIPSFWWHEVQSYPNPEEHRNLAVNFWYEPFLQKEFPCAECKLHVNKKYKHWL